MNIEIVEYNATTTQSPNLEITAGVYELGFMFYVFIWSIAIVLLLIIALKTKFLD